MTRPRRHPEQTEEEREAERNLIGHPAGEHEHGGHRCHAITGLQPEAEQQKAPSSPGTQPGDEGAC